MSGRKTLRQREEKRKGINFGENLYRSLGNDSFDGRPTIRESSFKKKLSGLKDIEELKRIANRKSEGYSIDGVSDEYDTVDSTKFCTGGKRK
ncbi:hypothetical protein HNV12_03905 [Methanococcoides sp. SA1]|nr:hypothetical protein [Methanococcoides sp. SA1]